MSKVNVFVQGASGHVGGAAVQYLLKHFGEHANVIAGVRTVSKASDLASQGVKVVEFDTDNASTLGNIKGADVAIIIPANNDKRTEQCIDTAKAAIEHGVKHIVLLSLIINYKPEAIFSKQMVPVEEFLKTSGVGYTFVRLPMFIENNWGNKGSIQQGAIYAPAAPTTKFNSLAIADVGAALASAVAHRHKFHNQALDVSGKPISQEELAAAFSKALGKEVKYVQVPESAGVQAMTGMGMPEWQANGIIELIRDADAGGRMAQDFTANFEQLVGHKPTTTEHWVELHAAGFK